MKNYIIIFLIFPTVFSSCQKDATNVKLPPAKILLVVQSFISPQEALVKVYVSKSTPIFGYKQQANYNTIKDATVEITNNNIVYKVLYSIQEDAYTIDSTLLKIIAGETYNLKVTHGTEMVTASCVVPYTLPFDLSLDKIELKAEIDQHTKDTMSTYYRLATSFTDLKSPSDYYRLFISSESKIWEYVYDNQGNIIDSNLNGRNNYAYFENDEHEFVTDAEYDNKKVIQNSTIFLAEGKGERIQRTSITFGIMHTDINYYKYHTSAIAHMNNQDNPFAEPSLVFTNIQGGLGIFAAYNYRYWVKNL
ncbi:MAG: DUF4249 domain-containing protein [Bacteroidota bacterium]|nr:DUF4249 domain-containing protein [Bacteroidota bacterium]